jgi:hypothetical protein
MTTPNHLKELLADLVASTIPPSGKRFRSIIDPKTKQVLEIITVDDPDATPWKITGDVISRRVGHGVNADAVEIESAATLGVRQPRQKHPHRGGRQRIYRRDAESGVQEASSESETEEEVKDGH